MDPQNLLLKLRTHKPLFDSIPPIHTKRICGLESEYGCVGFSGLSTEVLPNGGLYYTDCGHPEYATPEVSNPLSAALYYEAGKKLSHDRGFAEQLFCHNNSWSNIADPVNSTTYAAHESYANRVSRKEWLKLVPFLISRTVLCGTGWVDKRGQFWISQRAPFVECASSLETTSNRGIINLRQEALMSCGYDRLHIICGDATMNEVATFLRVGTLSLVLEMFELNALPEVGYDYSRTKEDTREVGATLKDWFLQGLTGDKGVIPLLSRYQEIAASLFAKRDIATDLLLAIWKDTLEKLARDPLELGCRLDWVTKLIALESFERLGDESGFPVGNDWIRSQDMEYHHLNPELGLYYLLRDGGQLERLFTPQLIHEATKEPPPDTRAYMRGKLVDFIRMRNEGFQRYEVTTSWSDVGVVDGMGIKRYFNAPTPDPFSSYATLLETFKAYYT